jgi:large subunit ribosomal protein L31
MNGIFSCIILAALLPFSTNFTIKRESSMKEKTHPAYQEVLFQDSSTGTQFLIGSTLQPKEKGMYQGREYPMVRIPISSASHPFFTKATQFLDTEGRVDKFTKKYQRQADEQKKRQEKQQEKQEEEKKAKLAQPKKK